MQNERISPEELRGLRQGESILWWIQASALFFIFLSVLLAGLEVFLWIGMGWVVAAAVAMLIVRSKKWRCPKCGEPLPWIWCAIGVLRSKSGTFAPAAALIWGWEIGKRGVFSACAENCRWDGHRSRPSVFLSESGPGQPGGRAAAFII